MEPHRREPPLIFDVRGRREPPLIFDVRGRREPPLILDVRGSIYRIIVESLP